MKTSTNTTAALRKKTTRIGLVLFTLLSIGMTSCLVVTDDRGRHGLDGRAYFGIDYDWNPPYSYWDNNASVPNNPFFGEMYRTMEGVYQFEYFINPYEYWYGTYEIFINPGLPGGPYGEDGIDGADNFLLLICNENGFYFEGWESCDCYRTLEDGTVVVEMDRDGQRYRVAMKKTTTSLRPSIHVPKYRANE